mmetsp:Transcript_123160/g.275072  ORF Transcript_123160/g.275072 Transcript_123160/m.275072 type:complete len:332 (-) Transcript_123160:65-1060(-)
MRLARLGRIVRMLRLFPEVLTLLKGIARAMRPVLTVMLMLIVLLFVFAILFKTQSSGNDALLDIFPSLIDIMGLLLLRGTLLDTPSGTFYAISETSPALGFTFLIFIFLSSFTVLNMLIGVLCDVVFEVTRVEKDDRVLVHLKSTILGLIECYDKDCDNHLALEEFDLLMANPETGQILRRFDVDTAGLRSLREVLFERTSSQGVPGEGARKKISFTDFLDVILRLRGGNNATVTDIMDLREYTRGCAECTNRRLESVEHQLSDIREMLISAGLGGTSTRAPDSRTQTGPSQSDSRTASSSKEPSSAAKLDTDVVAVKPCNDVVVTEEFVS